MIKLYIALYRKFYSNVLYKMPLAEHVTMLADHLPGRLNQVLWILCLPVYAFLYFTLLGPYAELSSRANGLATDCTVRGTTEALAFQGLEALYGHLWNFVAVDWSLCVLPGLVD